MIYSICSSATNGNRIVEAVKIIRKEKTDRDEHVGLYSMRVMGIRQEKIETGHLIYLYRNSNFNVILFTKCVYVGNG